MSNRFLQRDFFVCGLCNSVQRHLKGYKPIPNPVLFNATESTKAWHRETKDSVGYVDNYLMKKCDSCKTIHGSWSWIDFQEAMKRKQQQQQAGSSSSGKAGAGASSAEQH